MNCSNPTLCEKKDRPWFRRHRFLALFLLNLVLLVGFLAICEIGLRVFAPEWLLSRMDFLATGAAPEDFGTDRSWKTVKYNDRFVSFRPNSSMDVIHAEYRTTAKMDDLGGRKLEPQAKSLGEFIVCLGDSFTFGVGVENGETFVDHLQRENTARFLNLGVPGSALTSQRFIVEKRHSELDQPPLYFQFFFLGNDFEDILKASRSSPNPQRETSNPLPDESGWRKFSYKVNQFVNVSWLRYSYVTQFAKRVIMQATGDKRKNPLYEIMNIDSLHYHEKVRDALDSEIKKWKDLAREKDFRLVIVFVPDHYQLDGEMRRHQGKYYGIDCDKLDPLLPNQILSNCLDEQQIPYIDPIGDWIELSDRDIRELYYVNDNHFTAKGHFRFAEAIADEVKAAIKTSPSE